MQIKINKYQLSEIYNLNYKVFYPLNKFVSKKQFLSIVNKMEINKNVFFPIPIYLSLNKIPKSTKKIKVFYKNSFVCNLIVNEVYSFSYNKKIELGIKIFGTNDINHYGFNKFLFHNNLFIDCKIDNFNSTKNLIKFTKPKNILNLIERKKIKTLVGFHTRNVPHKAHEWIHKYGLQKCKNLMIQPLIGQYISGEYKESIIIKTNKLIVKELYKNKNVFFAILNSFPRYAGPREALFHALIRKNYGCSHFLVGRDHAGVKNYHGIYDSQKICKKFQTQLGIKIITFKEPFLCQGCKKIYNRKCNLCLNKKKLKISGTMIRTMIINNKKIPPEIMSKKFSKILKATSFIK